MGMSQSKIGKVHVIFYNMTENKLLKLHKLYTTIELYRLILQMPLALRYFDIHRKWLVSMPFNKNFKTYTIQYSLAPPLHNANSYNNISGE